MPAADAALASGRVLRERPVEEMPEVGFNIGISLGVGRRMDAGRTAI